ncbi:MAG: NAD-dependent epimerase/dehydratase family protein [Rhodocyclaceae bacterium]|nr:NAD-dependent epimerase/dehydratase family protein [Rhodocyclaceae bacterium]MDZ4216684.1 NAD-dependent epimerase/dehydratase family protein [Rhodocyclaceae bacterium]
MKGAVLLLGGGFIAQALSRQLVAAGREVHVLARRPTSREAVRLEAARRGCADFSGAVWHQGDAQDRALLQMLLPCCETVVHLASTTTPGVSARQPTLEIGNLAPVLMLLEVLQDFPTIHLIYFSSGGTLYGNPVTLPVAEEAPLRPLSYHGAGKAASELFLDVARQQGRAVTILRPANAYGPGQPLKPGFGLVRTMLEYLRRDTPLEIWGDGETVRDYVYIDDVAAACTLFVDRPDDSATYNVGSGTGYTINHLIKLASEVSGRIPKVIHHPGRVGDVARIVLDVSRLHATGWAPQVDLQSGLKRTWDWLRGQP